MAGTRGVLTTSAAFSTGSAANKTILRLAAPANTALLINAVTISFDGTSSTGSKISCELLRNVDADGTSTSRAPQKVNSSDAESLQATGSENFSAEMGSGSAQSLAQMLVHPQSGAQLLNRPFKLQAGQRLALRVNNPGAAVNCRASIEFEE